MKTAQKIISTFLLTFVILFTNSKLSLAQSVIPLIVAPARQQVTINPGESETLSVKFVNQSNSPLTGNVRAVDFIVTNPSGVPTLIETENALSSRFAASQWTKLPFDTASIPAEEILTVSVKITVPEDARPGGRYLAVYFEPTGTLGTIIGSEKEGSQAVSSRIVGLVYIRVSGPITESALVSRFEADNLVEYGPIKVLAEIVNKGDYHITPKGQVTLTDFMGRKIAQTALDEKNIFPDNSRIYELSIGPKILIGKFKLDLIASFGESGQVVTASRNIWVFPWKVFLVIVLTITILILFGKYIYKTIKGKQKKLEETLQSEITAIEELKEKYQDAVGSLPEKPKEQPENQKEKPAK